MGDYAVRMQFDIDADHDTVMRALTTPDGVARWWSQPVDGDPGKDGGEFRISFPDVPQPFVFAVERGDRSLAWRTLAFPPWWADTTIRWRVDDPDEGTGTRLVFAHEGFDATNPIIPIITPAWAQFIFGLQDQVEQDH
jgi:uncharacterized protein YndB with AHSA1/START domain